MVEKNLKGRLSEAKQAEAIIAEEVDKILERIEARKITPLIVKLQEQVEGWRKAELERVRTKLGDLTPQQHEVVDALVRSLANKMLHGPMSELRASVGKPEGEMTAEIVRRIFRLGDS